MNVVSQFMFDPYMEHWVVAKRIFRYLQGTQDLCLQYLRDGGEVTFKGFSYSDWVRDLNS